MCKGRPEKKCWLERLRIRWNVQEVNDVRKLSGDIETAGNRRILERTFWRNHRSKIKYGSQHQSHAFSTFTSLASTSESSQNSINRPKLFLWLTLNLVFSLFMHLFWICHIFSHFFLCGRVLFVLLSLSNYLTGLPWKKCWWFYNLNHASFCCYPYLIVNTYCIFEISPFILWKIGEILLPYFSK